MQSTLTNNGYLDWAWSAMPSDPSAVSLSFNTSLSTLKRGQSVTLSIKRLRTDISSYITIRSSGTYSSCFTPIVITLSTNCPHGSTTSSSYKVHGQDTCTICPAGYVCQNNIATPCTTGQYQATTGQGIACNSCPVGFFSDVEGSTACKSCSALSGQPLTTSDPSSGLEITGARSNSSCNCEAGYYRPSGSGLTGVCTPCTEGMSCKVGSLLPVQVKGYYLLWDGTSTATNIEAYLCSKSQWCRATSLDVANPMSRCADNRAGLTCDNCLSGYFPLEDNTGNCASCAGKSSAAVQGGLILALAIVILGAFALFVMRGERMIHGANMNISSATGVLLIAIQSLQAFNNLEVPWCDPLSSLRQIYQQEGELAQLLYTGEKPEICLVKKRELEEPAGIKAWCTQ